MPWGPRAQVSPEGRPGELTQLVEHLSLEVIDSTVPISSLVSVQWAQLCPPKTHVLPEPRDMA